MAFENLYTDDHWQDLLDTVVERVGIEKFLAMISKTLKKTDLKEAGSATTIVSSISTTGHGASAPTGEPNCFYAIKMERSVS